MVKNIEWLKREIEGLHKNVEVSTSGDYSWNAGYSKAISDCKTLVGWLSEEAPKPVTVPLFIEKYLDKGMIYSTDEKIALLLLSQSGGDGFVIRQTMVEENYLTKEEADEIDNWAGVKDVELLMNIAKYGYVNDLYYINFGGENGYAVRADDKNIGTQLVDEGMATRFSEGEIKALNNGHLFWHNFAEKA